MSYPNAQIWFNTSEDRDQVYIVRFGKSNLGANATYNECVFQGSAQLKEWERPEARNEKGASYIDIRGDNIAMTQDGRNYNLSAHDRITKNGKLRQFTQGEGILIRPNGKRETLS